MFQRIRTSNESRRDHLNLRDFEASMESVENELEEAGRALSDAERRVVWMSNVISLLRKHRQETSEAENRLARFMKMRDAFRLHRDDIERRNARSGD